MDNHNDTYYLYGMHPVTDAVLQGRKFEKILFKKGLEGEQFRTLLEEVTQRGIPYQFVPLEKLNHMVRGAHQGVVAYLAQIDYVPFEEMVENALSTKAYPVFLVLDGVSDVRNLGAIARSAECAGVDGIVVPAKGGAAINADAVKTSAGALLRVQIGCHVGAAAPAHHGHLLGIILAEHPQQAAKKRLAAHHHQRLRLADAFRGEARAFAGGYYCISHLSEVVGLFCRDLFFVF